MRARSREINIFNMSLLDILCGALGAFCFMMLVLLPYYKPANNDLRQEQANTDDLLRQLEKLKESAKDSELARQLNDVVSKLQEQVKQLQGEVNRYANENQRIQEENKNLTQTNDKQSSTLAMRHPFLTLVGTLPVQDLDLYLQSDNTTEDNKTTNPPFNLTKPHSSDFWSGDVSQWWSEHGISLWLTRDAPAGVHFKIYVKLAGEATARQAGRVTGSVSGGGWSIELPVVPLTPARFWTLMGTVTIDKDGKASFTAATDAERDAEWVKLSKGATPPPAATAAPSAAQRDAMPFSKDEMDKRREEYIRRRSQGTNATTSPSPLKSP